MRQVSIQTLSPQGVVSAVLRQLNKEQIEDAVACFTRSFRYKDHGIGLEFVDKERLTDFFRKHGSFIQITFCRSTRRS